MRLKAGLQILQKVVTNYADDATRLISKKGDDVIKAVFTSSDDVSRGRKIAEDFFKKQCVREREIASAIDFSDFEIGFEKIKFRKAESLEDAQKFAQQELGISRFDFTDLEMANQFNLSTTRAFNKTGCRDFIPEEVVMDKLSGIKSLTKEDLASIPAATLQLKGGKQRVVFSTDFLNQIDDILDKNIDYFAKLGQISKNDRGIEQINLICDYRYSHTLNRYFKLYKEGKLSKKAKLDFFTLLNVAKDEQRMLLSRQRRAVGMDALVLHEEGHVFHSKVTGNQHTSLLQYANPKENELIQREISTYAGENPGEMVGEKFAETLSGAKYSEEVENVFEKYVGKQIPNI